MVMRKTELDALAGVRKAILADVAEDMSMIGEMTEWHASLVEAWNAFADAGPHGDPITEVDIKVMLGGGA